MSTVAYIGACIAKVREFGVGEIVAIGLTQDVAQELATELGIDTKGSVNTLSTFEGYKVKIIPGKGVVDVITEYSIEQESEASAPENEPLPFGIKRSEDELERIDELKSGLKVYDLTPGYLVAVRALLGELLELHATGGFSNHNELSENVFDGYSDFIDSLVYLDVAEGFEEAGDKAWPKVRDEIVARSHAEAEKMATLGKMLDELFTRKAA